MKFIWEDEWLKYYQEHFRVYLDEFPEVEEWNYIPLFDNTVLMKRFMVKE